MTAERRAGMNVVCLDTRTILTCLSERTLKKERVCGTIFVLRLAITKGSLWRVRFLICNQDMQEKPEDKAELRY